ncbi:hypothetical protein [Clostridium merdae]|uniref:hypothetical protein n=1 Tax=Clostridium merdae TaxID=1958780 RepID=UPI000A26771F|nr:hypothetical protein [Clostridium merdae]
MQREKAPEKVVAFPFYKKLLPLAACFLILVVGSFIVQNMLSEPSKPLEHTAPNIVSYDTGKDLSNALGFGVKQIGKL